MVRGKCTVCDSPNATNFHFGAQSCKACAAFFRRSISMEQSYDCLGDGQRQCRIDHTLRLNCRHCRLKKCLRAGMDKDLVQAKKPSRNLQICEFPQILDSENPSTSCYPPSENEFGPNSPKMSKLMDEKEFSEFIRFSDESSSRLTSISESSVFYYSGLEEEERLYSLAALYTDQATNLNMRRRITYTDKLLGSVFDGPCVCPYEVTDLKRFDHRTYRQKNRSDYTMILDYINRFPEFELLTKSEKTVLFRTAAAVDVLLDQAWYSQMIYPSAEILVTANGEFLSISPLENRQNFDSDEDFNKYKALTSMKLRQWKHVCEPMKKLKMSLPEFALFKALTIWHYNHYKLQESGRQVCARQRDDIFRTLLLICDDEGHEDALLRASEVVLAVGDVMAEVHEMVTSYIEITVLDVLDDPILKDMLKFQY